MVSKINDLLEFPDVPEHSYNILQFVSLVYVRFRPLIVITCLQLFSTGIELLVFQEYGI